MTGEMYSIDPMTATEPNGTEWPFHKAMAEAVGGTVQPFDQYQGPYVLVGNDMRIGDAPYQLAVQRVGIIRLWLTEDRVYREDTDTLSKMVVFEPCDAAEAARELLGEEED